MPRSAATIVYLLIGCTYLTWAPPLGTSLPFIPANIADTMFTPAHSVIRAIGFQPSMTRVVQILFTMHASQSIYIYMYSSSASSRVAIEFCLCLSGCDLASFFPLLPRQSAYWPCPNLVLSFLRGRFRPSPVAVPLAGHHCSPLLLPHQPSSSTTHQPWTTYPHRPQILPYLASLP